MKKIKSICVTFILVILLSLTSSVLGIAQNLTPIPTPQEPTQTIIDNEVDGFPIIIDDKTIFIVRRGVGSFSAEERAKTITKEIKAIAKNDSISPEKIIIKKNPEDNYPYLAVDGNILLSITAQDVKAYSKNPDQLAQEALEKVQVAITDYHPRFKEFQFF